MLLSHTGAEVFVPDGTDARSALSRTTHLGIGAHPDDLEIMAIHGILECYDDSERSFTGVVATDGAGGPTSSGRSPTDVALTRRAEQKAAASLGRYGALVLLDHASRVVKARSSRALEDDLLAVLDATRPDVVYTHNLADAHDTHVALALDVISACRRLESALRPKRVIGCEVWRGLDWLPRELKLGLPSGDRPELELALIRAFESQLAAGKHYDLGAAGRRRANATFSDALAADRHAGLVFGMDLTSAAHAAIEPLELLRGHVRAFEAELEGRLRRLAR